jgi:hypothetical protein
MGTPDQGKDTMHKLRAQGKAGLWLIPIIIGVDGSTGVTHKRKRSRTAPCLFYK